MACSVRSHGCGVIGPEVEEKSVKKTGKRKIERLFDFAEGAPCGSQNPMYDIIYYMSG